MVKDIFILLPEIFIIFTLMACVLSEIFEKNEKIRLVGLTAMVGLVGALVQTLLAYQFGAVQAFNQTITVDGFSLFFKQLFILHALIVVLLALQLNSKEGSGVRSEFFILILGACLAELVAASSSDLIISFLCLQLVNLVSAGVTTMNGKRHEEQSRAIRASAGLFIHSLFFMFFFLFAAIILFIHTGSFNLHEIHRQLLINPLSRPQLLFIVGLFSFSFMFQVAGFPFHFWSVRVYGDATKESTPFTGFAVRAVGFAVGLRIFLVLFSKPGIMSGAWEVLGSVQWPSILGVLSAFTMFVGALLALRRTRARELVASLLVFQSGFLLIGLVSLDQVGVAATLYGIGIELFSVVGAYYTIGLLESKAGSDQYKDLKGMLRHAGPETVGLVLFLFGIVGLPPLSGFVSKFTLIGVGVRHHWYLLALTAVVSFVIGIAAVVRFVFHLIGDFSRHESGVIHDGTMGWSFSRVIPMAILVLPLFLTVLFAEVFLGLAGQSLGLIFW